jgi:hypothetical protein
MELETVVVELRTQVPTWAEDRYFATDIEAGRSIGAEGLSADRSYLPSFASEDSQSRIW